MMLPRLKADRIELEGGHRLYQPAEPEWPDRFYPSVTTILDHTKPDEDRKGIEAWRERVGHLEADRIRTEAAARGTALHEEIQAYLGDPFRCPGAPTPPGSPWFNSVSGLLGSLDPLLIEGPVWRERGEGLTAGGYAGTVDCVARGPDGREAVIDWKTSSKRKRREWIHDHELQVAAYTSAVRERYGLRVELAAVVVAYDDGGPCDVFWLDTSQLRSAWAAFVYRRAAYAELHEVPG